MQHCDYVAEPLLVGAMLGPLLGWAASVGWAVPCSRYSRLNKMEATPTAMIERV